MNSNQQHRVQIGHFEEKEEKDNKEQNTGGSMTKNVRTAVITTAWSHVFDSHNTMSDFHSALTAS